MQHVSERDLAMVIISGVNKIWKPEPSAKTMTCSRYRVEFYLTAGSFLFSNFYLHHFNNSDREG